jgi:hypothetical protein
MISYHKLPISQFDNKNYVKTFFSWVVFFAHKYCVFKTCIIHNICVQNYMKIFHLFYMCILHTCFRHMIFMCKNYKLIKLLYFIIFTTKL